MTPMIDVVFQLLIYFVVSFKAPDIFSSMEINLPQPDKDRVTQSDPPAVKIGVYDGTFTLDGRQVSVDKLRERCQLYAENDTHQHIIVLATAESSHRYLIEVLETLQVSELRNISVISTD